MKCLSTLYSVVYPHPKNTEEYSSVSSVNHISSWRCIDPKSTRVSWLKADQLLMLFYVSGIFFHLHSKLTTWQPNYRHLVVCIRHYLILLKESKEMSQMDYRPKCCTEVFIMQEPHLTNEVSLRIKSQMVLSKLFWFLRN